MERGRSPLRSQVKPMDRELVVKIFPLGSVEGCEALDEVAVRFTDALLLGNTAYRDLCAEMLSPSSAGGTSGVQSLRSVEQLTIEEGYARTKGQVVMVSPCFYHGDAFGRTSYTGVAPEDVNVVFGAAAAHLHFWGNALLDTISTSIRRISERKKSYCPPVGERFFDFEKQALANKTKGKKAKNNGGLARLTIGEIRECYTDYYNQFRKGEKAAKVQAAEVVSYQADMRTKLLKAAPGLCELVEEIVIYNIIRVPAVLGALWIRRRYRMGSSSGEAGSPEIGAGSKDPATKVEESASAAQKVVLYFEPP
jgi:hypothetical protein